MPRELPVPRRETKRGSSWAAVGSEKKLASCEKVEALVLEVNLKSSLQGRS